MNFVFAFIIYFVWGTCYAVAQYTVPHFPPLLLALIRALPAGLIFFAIKPSFPKFPHHKPLAILGLINIAIFFVLIFVMASTLPAAISGVGMISVPVFAMIYQVIFLRKKPSLVEVISGIVLIALAYLLFSPGSMKLNPVGLLALLGAIICIVVGSNLTQKAGKHLHWWTIITWELLFAGIALIIANLVAVGINPHPYVEAFSHFDLKNLIGLLWIIIVTSAFGYGFSVWLLQHMSVVDFTFGNIANPIAGVLSGYLLLNNTYSLSQYSLMVGMVVVALIPQIVTKIKNKSDKPQTELRG